MDYGRITVDALAHEDAVNCLVYGDICNLLLSGSGDCTVKVWKNVKPTTKDIVVQCLVKHLDHNSAVFCICFDP